ncbi:MAG TPA: 16S rRNA (guanine(966)-N(2))-methyltransferase RsmD [Bryobacteraceae bacterium]|jgi:16S rRNA (guanine(966)-N(2))-methyltransferase RsmD
MRVIGGEFRSRLLKSLPGLDVRPTPDRLREALFNVIAPRTVGTIFADVYAGTGAVGIEALSRGAERAIFVEQSRSALGVIRANVKALGLEDRVQILQGRVSALLPGVRADIVFLDPPYRLAGEYDKSMEILGATMPGLVVAQHDVRQKLAEAYGRLVRARELRQGDNVLSFYEPAPLT